MVCQPVLDATGQALVTFLDRGIADGGHEGIVYWCGHEAPDITVFLHAIIPEAEHGPQSVMVSRASVGRAQRHARSLGLGLLSQIHSHPGTDARHSDGDDDLILLPFEGMLSIVVPNFGRHFRRLSDACVHQFQDGRWVLCTASSLRTRFITVPSVHDLR
jgi:hypothetical protein